MKYIILSIFVFIQLSMAFSQETIIVEYDKYLYQNNTYNYNSIGEILAQNPESALAYDEYKSKIKSKNNFLIVGGVTFIVGGTIFGLGVVPALIEGKKGLAYTGFFILGMSTFCTIAGLIPRRRHLIKAIDIYNNQHSKTHSYLELRTTPSGVGLVYNF